MPAPDPDATVRQLQRSDAVDVNSGISYPAGDDAEAAYAKWRETDPFPDIAPALLNSADIVDYVAVTGMVDPFDPRGLKSASYEMKLRGPYIYVDEKGTKREGQLSSDDDQVVVARNGITFLTVEPFFRIPDYIALRHNLKIDHVYKGLLVGTGPLIDPGFVGRISLPLHNLTENDYTFRAGDGIIWVEFTKLSQMPNRTHAGAVSATGPAAASLARQGRYVPFPAEKTRSRTVNDYIKSAVGTDPVPASSTARTNRRAKKALKSAKRTQTVFGSFTLAGALTVGTIMSALILPRISDLREDNREQRQRIAELEIQVDHLQQGSGQSRPSPNADPSAESSGSGSPSPRR